MKVYKELTGVGAQTAVALGLFDGLHRGHRAVIERAVEQKANGLIPVVLTFSTGRLAPQRKQGMKRLLTETLQMQAFEQVGAEVVEIPAFERLKEFSPQEFVERILVDLFHARVIVCGFNFRFGKNAAGDVVLLRELCAHYGIELVTVPALMDGGEPVSSSRIRSCLLEGKIEDANRMLGYPYSFDFEVAHGLEIGRQIGIPTINQIYPESFLIPKFGVYASYSFLNGKRYRSITNVGVKPTIAGERLPLAETHIMGINAHLYGQHIKVGLVRYMRGERKFDSIDALSAEIHANIETILRELPD